MRKNVLIFYKSIHIHARAIDNRSHSLFEEIVGGVHWEKKRLTYDFHWPKKMYNEVQSEASWRYIERRAILMTYLRMIKDMYDEAKTE